jgi:hypothetical protein
VIRTRLDRDVEHAPPSPLGPYPPSGFVTPLLPDAVPPDPPLDVLVAPDPLPEPPLPEVAPLELASSAPPPLLDPPEEVPPASPPLPSPDVWGPPHPVDQASQPTAIAHPPQARRLILGMPTKVFTFMLSLAPGSVVSSLFRRRTNGNR